MSKAIKQKRTGAIYILIMLSLSLGFPFVLAMFGEVTELNYKQLFLDGIRDFLANAVVLGLISYGIVLFRRRRLIKNQYPDSKIIDSELLEVKQSPIWFDWVENLFSLYLILTAFAIVTYIVSRFFF